jgi:hypothetical protein
VTDLTPSSTDLAPWKGTSFDGLGLTISTLLTEQQFVRLGRQILAAEGQTKIRINFAKGDWYNALGEQHGDKADLIRREFGDGHYQQFKTLGWIARAFQRSVRTDQIEHWFVYHRLAGASPSVRDKMIAEYRAGARITEDELRQRIAAEERAIAPAAAPLFDDTATASVSAEMAQVADDPRETPDPPETNRGKPTEPPARDAEPAVTIETVSPRDMVMLSAISGIWTIERDKPYSEADVLHELIANAFAVVQKQYPNIPTP